MTDTPERIWAIDLDGTGSMHPSCVGDDGAVEYVRADLLDAANARIAELEAMLTDDLTAPYLAGLARGRAEMREDLHAEIQSRIDEVGTIDSGGLSAAIRALKGGSNG